MISLNSAQNIDFKWPISFQISTPPLHFNYGHFLKFYNIPYETAQKNTFYVPRPDGTYKYAYDIATNLLYSDNVVSNLGCSQQ